MLKKLFYASASILMLAVSYHLGATNAQGQASGQVFLVGYLDHSPFVATPSGDYYQFRIPAGGVSQGQWVYQGNIFNGNQGGRTLVAFSGDCAMTSSGEVFMSAGQNMSTPWVNLGVSPAGGPTPAAQQTFGQLKAQYRR